MPPSLGKPHTARAERASGGPGGAWTLAAARDPVRHLNWVKFVLTFPIVLLVTLAFAALRGDVAFRQVAIDIGFDALFAVLFLVFYPRGAQSGVSSPRA